MTSSELEALKTNEFLRRRKLRIQQVREQSKDIAKRIRQRAKVEALRQIESIDSMKADEYLEHQEKFVKRLELLYSCGIKNIGTGHKNAEQIKLQGESSEKTDASISRGREAAAELKRKKQEKLDVQKKILDRKLQAREAANEFSREKSSTVASKLLAKSSSSKCTLETAKSTETGPETLDLPVKDKFDNREVYVNGEDEANIQEKSSAPNELLPNIPILLLPDDNQDSIKCSKSSARDINLEKKARPNLFAVSDEMPSSLRGSLTQACDETNVKKPSITRVSEYILGRDLRLRETNSVLNKKSSDDLVNIKQTILQSRVSRSKGIGDASVHSSVCRVVDEQVVPMPSWQAEINCNNCSCNLEYRHSSRSKQSINNLHPQNSDIFSSIELEAQRSLRTHPILRYLSPSSKQYPNVLYPQINEIYSAQQGPRPDLRGSSPFRRRKVSPHCLWDRGTSASQPSEGALATRNVVKTYNHSTRNTQDRPSADMKLVTRDTISEEDAYSLAMKESSCTVMDKELQHQNKVQDMRNKVAMRKELVNKEYNDTMEFLKNLPKDSKPIITAYRDENRQQAQHERKQRLMQNEFKKIQKDFRKQAPVDKEQHSLSKSPRKLCSGDRGYQYAWMPVPNEDEDLVVHNIPTDTKNSKGSSVKFAAVDSYHEYRSRHKHTPPTKDTEHARVAEEKDSESIDGSLASEASSVESLGIPPKEIGKTGYDMSDVEQLIVDKLLDPKTDVESKSKYWKLLTKIAKKHSPSKADTNKCHKKTRSSLETEAKKKTEDSLTKTAKDESRCSIRQVADGVYEVNEKRESRKSTCMSDIPEKDDCEDMNSRLECSCQIKSKVQWEFDDKPPGKTSQKKCKYKANSEQHTTNNSANTPRLSFKTQDKCSDKERARLKLVDDTGNEAGKFYIGATGFLKDDDYEVIIQLRKKDGSKDEKKEDIEAKESATGLQEQVSVTQLKPKTQSEGDRNCIDSAVQAHLCTDNVQSSSTNPQMTSGNAQSSNDNIQPVADNIQPIADNILPITVCDNVYLQPKTQSVRDSLPNTVQSRTGNADSNVQVSSGNIQSFSNAQSSTLSQETSSSIEFIKPKTPEPKGHSAETVNTKDANNNKTELNKGDVPESAKTDPIPRATTSTQTSLGSPIHRPDIYMSSSTSTAYMSPPDNIIPQYLKSKTMNYLFVKNNANRNKKQEYRDNDKVCKSKYSPPPTKPMNQRNEPIQINKNQKKTPWPINGTHRQLKERPKTSRISYDNNLKAQFRLQGTLGRQLKPPSNTPRSTSSNARTSSSLQAYLGRSYKTSKAAINNVPLKNIKSKYLADSAPITCSKSRNNKKVPVAPKRSGNLARDNASKNTKKNIPKNMPEKDSLAPIIKAYVDKLLKLNKAGMKAVEVMGVECSAVSTPGSSVIKVRPNSDYDVATAVNVMPKISLEQLKDSLVECMAQKNWTNQHKHMFTKTKSLVHLPRKKSVHKVKSLNISKHFFHRKSNDVHGAKSTEPTSTSSTKDDCPKTNKVKAVSRKIRSKSSLSPRIKLASDQSDSCEMLIHVKRGTKKDMTARNYKKSCRATNKYNEIKTPDWQSPDVSSLYDSKSLSTQTNNELNFTKIGTTKLQNMEKIADLTEKCTIRLSNLAKVLNEVRKSKSTHSRVSDSEPDICKDDLSSPNCVSNVEHHQRENVQSVEQGTGSGSIDLEHHKQVETAPKITPGSHCDKGTSYSFEYASFLADIAKPRSRSPVLEPSGNTSEVTPLKNRGKPPPALSRKILKHTVDVVPHELSTVLEVDSPSSIKFKTPSKGDQIGSHFVDAGRNKRESPNHDLTNPDLLQPNVHKEQINDRSDSLNRSKIEMMDLKQFNDIMLKPFMSIEEYSKQFTREAFDDRLKTDPHPKPAPLINDDLSSYHSESSLPDVVAELLKRNIINEPFKFDTASNGNSITVSSESTMSSLSLLALSKIRKEKKPRFKIDKPDSSDTMSISSNPDLENAFKGLGMGWATSTLKKTKERLALSSSSNSSTSSFSHSKLNIGKHAELAVPVSDTVSSATSLSNKKKDVEQQTSHSKSMTVKQFLARELADKITFTHTPRREEAEEEFVSLFETKVPENMKDSEVIERSAESARSGNNARARTSTPVRIFRSATYHSSSESASNGLFSNADELSSVKGTSNSNKHNSTTDKDDLTIPNYSLLKKKTSDCSD